MAAGFLLLEIMDPAVNAFLWTLRDILSYPEGRSRSRAPIHITIRGPYEKEIPREAIENATKALRHDVLRIAEPGRFSNSGSEEIVFLNVDSPNLRSIWWKPSFPIGKNGFTPHISLYKGADREFADLVAKFLKKEKINLFVAEHRVSPHRTGQPSLLGPRAPTIDDQIKMFEANKIDTSLLDRLTELRDEYRFRSGSPLGKVKA